MSKNVQIQAGKKKLTHADNDIYGIIEMFVEPVRFSFIQNAVLYTEEQIKVSLAKLIDAGLIDMVAEDLYKLKLNNNENKKL
jgi:hypothetical protein